MSVSGWRIVVRTPGGPEAMEREAISFDAPAPGEVLVRHEAIGLNFIDTYVRSGLYPATLPTGLGGEAAGVVEAVGDGVARFAPGDRVGYVTGAPGAYATHRILSADHLLPLPDNISSEAAAATMLKGMTVAFLTTECAQMQAGQSALVHAAAGGVGSLLVPWLRDMGVTVFAHSGSQEKAERASKLGANHSLIGSLDGLAGQIRALTDDKGVDVAFDGVGKDSWPASLAAVCKRGLIVSYGNASGAVPPISLLDLNKAGSLFVTRPSLFHYIDTAEEYRALGERLFDRIARGVVRTDVSQRFALSQAADAHRALESRQTVGSTVLVPD